MPIPLGILIGFGDGGEANESDYRPVPSSDTGETYRDRGMFGFYESNRGEPFAPPSDVKFDAGYGGSEADLKRGYSEPLITNAPNYQLDSYKDRYSQPMVSDTTPGNVDAMRDDFEFHNRNRESKGFLSRPRIPRERN